MNTHEEIFDKIKLLLWKYLPELLEQEDDGMYLAIRNTGVWVSLSSRELTIGYGMTHIHYDAEYDDLSDALQFFLNLLTCKRKVTKYYKGSFFYKNKVELLLTDGAVYDVGVTMTWLFPYWKNTRCEVEIQDEIINRNEIDNELLEVDTYL